MISGHRRAVRTFATAAGVAMLVAACGLTTLSSSPFTTAPPSAASPSTPPSTAPSGRASPATSDSPPAATATAKPGASAPAPTACPIEPQTGRLPSDRIVDVVISGTESADLVTFVFGDWSLPTPPQGSSKGSLDAAEPPFTHGSSGLPMTVDGEHVANVRFTGMSLSNDLGQPTYDGPVDFRPNRAALKTIVAYDMSEGIMGWFIGYDGAGCVTLSSDARSVTVTIAHPAS